MEGKIYKDVKTFMGDVACEEVGDFLVCSVVVGAQTVIKFPLAKGADTNKVALKVANVVNQTELVPNSVTVEMIEEP